MATPLFPSRKIKRRERTAARFAPRLVIMIKEPVAGRVKTRLARDIGVVAATAAYRAMVNSICARLGNDRRWETILAVSPDTAAISRMLPNKMTRMPQGGGDLGQRLHSVFERAHAGPVIVIGTDSPGITQADIAQAFRALGSSDVVFGPAPDGGYWLVGIKRWPRLPRAFDRVRWSSEHALVDTEANLKGLRIARLQQRDDIDDARDLAKLQPLIGRRILPQSIRD